MCLFDNVFTIYPAQLLSEPTFQDTILTFLIKHPVALLSSPWDVVLIFTLPTKNSKSFINFKTMDFKWSKTLNSRTAILLLTSTQQEGSGCFYRDTIFRTNSVIHSTQWEPPNSLINFTRKQVIKCSSKPTRDYIFCTRQHLFTLKPESLQLPP